MSDHKKDEAKDQDKVMDALEADLANMTLKDTSQPLSSTDIDGIAKFILEGHAKNIIVMTGAGISVSAGIPDFRSPGTGLYHNLQKYKLKRAEDVFDIDYFQKNPKPFHEVVKGIYPGQFHPTKAHYFIRLLAEHGLLLRDFTQNIDTLELIAEIPQDKVVYAHGGFASAHCVRCHKKYSPDYVRERVFADEIVKCDCGSYVKPDIVFFGEPLPRRFFDCLDEDFPKCDLLIVMGTSLQVQPFASLINEVGKSVPRLLINREVVGTGPFCSGGFDFDDPENHRDALFKGDCDDGIQKLADALGWGKELQNAFDAPVSPKFQFKK